MKKVFVLFLFASLCFTGTASAFGLSDLSSAVSSDSSESPKANVDNLNNEQAKLKKRLVNAMMHMLSAQVKVLDATGDKEAAGKAANQVKVLKAGNVQDEEIDKSVALTEENDKAIAEKEKSMNEMDASSKKKVASALIPYALGVVDISKLNSDFANWLNRAQSKLSSASVTNALSLKRDLGFGLNIAPKLPSLTSQTTSTTHKLLAFCKSNELETKGAEDALGDL